MHARADTAASWPEEIFSILQRFEVRQVPYVPDAGHSELIERVLGSSSMRGIALTTEEEGVALLAGAWAGGQRGEWGEFNPWQVPMGSNTQGILELSGIKVLRASRPDEVREVVEAGAAQAYNACTPTAVLLSQRLIGAKVFTK